MKGKWNKKPGDRKFPGYLYNEYIDIEQSFQWMKLSGHKGEKE